MGGDGDPVLYGSSFRGSCLRLHTRHGDSDGQMDTSKEQWLHVYPLRSSRTTQERHSPWALGKQSANRSDESNSCYRVGHPSVRRASFVIVATILVFLFELTQSICKRFVNSFAQHRQQPLTDYYKAHQTLDSTETRVSSVCPRSLRCKGKIVKYSLS